MPCSVLLDRDDSNRYLSRSPNIATTDQESTSSDCILNPIETDESIEALSETTDTPPNKATESPEPLKSRTPSKASITSDDIPLRLFRRKRMPPKKPTADLSPTDELMTKRRKIPTQKTNPTPNNKKPLKAKPSPQKSVCFLCGEQFASGIQLTQHQKTHFASTISQAPVFPCNVCGRKVKNLKVHLRLHKKEQQHQLEQQQQSQASTTNGKIVKRRGKQTKSNESQTSTGSTKSNCVTEGAESSGMAPMPVPVETRTFAELTVASSDTFVKRAEASSSTDAVYSRIPCETNEEAELISSNEMFAISNDSNVSSYNFIGDCMTDSDALLIFSDQFMLPPPPSSSTSCVAIIDPSFVPSAMDPLSLMDEDPLEMPSLIDLDAICVNEPSQSTSAIEPNDEPRLPPQQSNAENTFQPNGLNVDARRKKKNEKSNDEQFGDQSQQVVANQPPFKCSKCPRHFDTLDRVTKHCKKHDKKTNCKYCGKLLAQSYVYFHISKYHKAEREMSRNPVNTAEEEEEGDGEEDEELEDTEAATIETEAATTQMVAETEHVTEHEAAV